MQATVAGLLGRETLHARIEDIKKAKGAAPWVEKLVSIRLAITPPGEFHRYDRPEGEGPA